MALITALPMVIGHIAIIVIVLIIMDINLIALTDMAAEITVGEAAITGAVAEVMVGEDGADTEIIVCKHMVLKLLV